MKRRLLILAAVLAAALVWLCPAGAEQAQKRGPVPRSEDYDDVVLYGICCPGPGTGWVSAGCVDTAGNFWLAERADVRWPAPDEDIRDMLRTRRGMRLYSSLLGDEADGTVLNDAWFSEVVPGMVSAIPQPGEKPRKTGIGAGWEGVWGLRKNGDGEEESVLLGMAGSDLYENPSPDAQRLYLFMWRLLTLNEIFSTGSFGYAAEGVSPQGFRGIPVREFFGLAGGGLERASVSAVWLDADGGPVEADLSPSAAEDIRALAARGMVIRKESVWHMPEDVLTCTFTDAQGNRLGEIRLFTYALGTNEEGGNILRTLAVADDGMYQVALEPRPVDTLTEEELRIMTVRIEGVDYTVGKSTPRDLVRSGWNCFPEWNGTFTFSDPEGSNTIEVLTRGDSLDEPILSISCWFTGEAGMEYCGFDGITGPEGPEDPDSSVCCPLSDGRYLYLSSGGSSVAITLSENGPDAETW